MGQYYKPIKLEKPLEYLSCYDYGSGAKLMEHSWMKNDFVGAVESLLIKGGAWYKKPLIWGGDYADETLKPKDYNNSEDYKDMAFINEYMAVKESNKRFPIGMVVKEKYILNHTKKEYVDKKKVLKDSDGWRIHPLPLLTCDGNGLGGGDFHINEKMDQGNTDLIGSWARDVISVESRKPTKKMGFKEIDFNLVEFGVSKLNEDILFPYLFKIIEQYTINVIKIDADKMGFTFNDKHIFYDVDSLCVCIKDLDNDIRELSLNEI